MDLDRFLTTLGSLDAADFASVAAAVEQQAASAAGEVAWWHATVQIERLVRQRRSCREATSAGRRVAQEVRVAAGRAGIVADDPSVLVVSRAAAEIARGLVAGDARHVAALMFVWPTLRGGRRITLPRGAARAPDVSLRAAGERATAGPLR